jgi:hypothetical protein
MCPPTLCPRCRSTTYHKGSCENVRCSFDPLRTTAIPATASPADLDALRSLDEVEVCIRQRPFVHIRVTAPTIALLQEAIELLILGTVPIFQNPGDLIDPPGFGFDLVKEHAKPYLVTS